GGDTRQAIAQKIARQADLILFVIAGDLTQLEYTALSELHRAGKPILVVFNKTDQFPMTDRDQIVTMIQQDRLAGLIPPENIVMAAAAPLVTQAIRQADGSIHTHRERGAADVEALKLKILEILQREGKALVAINTLLYADDINEQVVAKNWRCAIALPMTPFGKQSLPSRLPLPSIQLPLWTYSAVPLLMWP
ncbi:MAG: hypothetical protein AAFO06_16065, partial [Cyanobacteria bacterium J06597_16]